MRRTHSVLAVLTLTAVLLPGAVAPVLAQDQGNSEQARINAYWTRDRIAHAIPRDFARLPGGQFVPDQGKPGGGGGGGGGTNNVIGASWNGGGQIVTTSGKVLFTMAGVDYICSGAVINDDRNDYSIVLTAGHCSYDETNGAFATNWTFYPAFDTNATYDCGTSAYGCWYATALVVDSGFATAGGFNDQATHHDWSFGVVPVGGNSSTQLDSTAGSFGYTFDAPTAGAQIFDFGYPAAGKYHGYDLIYCADQVFYDANNGNTTLGIDCNMTGGSSGGPWLTGFSTSTGMGTLSSVNSYGYTSIRNKEYGPKFNGNTSATYAAASFATAGGVIVNVPN
jgi:V8-like Glu-specific endopeptidase